MNYVTYIQAEREFILRKKGQYGEQINQDPGESFVMEWVRNHAKDFRAAWVTYNCETCMNKMNCPTDFQGCTRQSHNRG
ncbi:hypothetical protein [Chitinivibrio alkaliphilus]|uniref:Uncharacterized protein n=1 Tax=Chitinivibrio alkaliphilus ACht1 TaxID=1313304 RepID=U7DBA3_9BACT|nr:hypothetical protein [Chitinivibrio alkaliphilus]ERP38838.1 hypothetical protein CALK_0610 [Chitinivibrio alkaliphilus ACht1]